MGERLKRSPCGPLRSSRVPPLVVPAEGPFETPLRLNTDDRAGAALTDRNWPLRGKAQFAHSCPIGQDYALP